MAVSLTIHDALNMAIKEEIKAHTLYFNLSKRVESQGTRNMLIELAEQEKGHRQLLEGVVQNEAQNQLGQKIDSETGGIVNFMTETKLQKDATPQEVMVYAIKAEQKAIDFYTDLGNDVSEPSLQDIFMKLASEEKGHRTKLEDEYEEHFMKDN